MPQIEGKNWNAEVVDRSFKREKIRNEFYEKLAKLKLGIETNPETVLGNPSASGLKTHEELAKASGFSSETEKGSTLSAILHTYFKENIGITDAKTRGREVALSLYALTRQKDAEGRAINVDYLNLKWKIEIKAGQLFISNQKGEKIVDGAYLRKPADGAAAAAAAPTGEVGGLSEAASRFVTRIRERSKEKRSLNEILGKVQEGLNVGKKKIDAVIETATPDEIADSTNAWRAWTRDGFLKGPENLELRKSLQKFIFDSEEEIPPAHKKYARQLWRTDMVSHISKKLMDTTRTDKGIVIEKIMGAMRVTDSEDEPAEALKSAMLLDPKIRDREARQELAKQMEASGTHGKLLEIINQLNFLKTGETVPTVKIVVGGDMISFPAGETAETLKYKHAIFVERENRIYAQMENGCMGNLVIIEKVPAPTPEPPPEPPPPGPGPEPPPGPDIPEGGGKTPVPPRPEVPEGGGRTPVPPKPVVPEGSGRTPIPPKPVVPEGSGRTPVPPKPTVPEGSGRTAVPPKPVVPEGSGRTPIPPKPAPEAVPEGSGRTAVPPKPEIPEGGGKTAVPPKPAPAAIPEGSGRTAIPPKPAPAAPPEGGGRIAVPARPAAPAAIPEGSGRTAIPPKPAPVPTPIPEGGGKTAVPSKPAPAPLPPPEGSGKTVVPAKPAPAPAPVTEGSGKTAVPAKPAPTPAPVPEGGGKTAIPPKPAAPIPVPEGGGRTTIPAKPAPIPPPTPEGIGRTAVPAKPAPAPPAPPPEGAGKTQVPPKPAPAQAPEGGGKTAVPPPPEGSGKTTVPPLDEGEPVRPPE